MDTASAKYGTELQRLARINMAACIIQLVLTPLSVIAFYIVVELFNIESYVRIVLEILFVLVVSGLNIRYLTSTHERKVDCTLKYS